MKKKSFVCTAVTMLAVMLVIGLGSAAAFENVTAQEAYDMVNNGEAILIDVRTLEECLWVGMPDVKKKRLYIIPWLTKTISPDGTVTTIDDNGKTFEALVEQTFGKGRKLITMCRSGKRSSAAADRLEELGFNHVYEMDNCLKEEENGYGGRGGFQGTSYGDMYDGYRGYPGRLVVETDTDNIKDPESSVSWMDTGLPITQTLSNAKIPVLPPVPDE